MGELGERRWGVISERGREAAGLAYAEAAALVAELRRGKVGGLCVVTEAAAARLAPAPPAPAPPATPPPDVGPKRPRRAAKK